MKGQGQYRPAFEMVERLRAQVIESKSDARRFTLEPVLLCPLSKYTL